MVTFSKEIYIHKFSYLLFIYVYIYYIYIYSSFLFLHTHIYVYRHIYDDKGGIFMGGYDALLVCEQVLRKPLSDKILHY